MPDLTLDQIYDLLNRPGPLWLVGVNLSGANLSAANLVGANLSESNLSGAPPAPPGRRPCTGPP